MAKISDYCFMQNDAKHHWTQETFDLLAKHLIGLDSEKKRGNGINWPPYSPDLHPYDVFLMEHLKHKIYHIQPLTYDDLKIANEHEVIAIRLDYWKK